MTSKEIETAGPACDSATIMALRDEGDGLLAELIDIFTIEAPRQMELLERALVRRESVDASRIAHTLKGTAGVFGAFKMESLAAQIEHAARRASFATAIAVYTPLRAEIDRVAEALAVCRQQS